MLLKDANLPGRNSAERLKLGKFAKAEIYQSPEEIERYVDKILEDPDLLNALSKWDALQGLEENFASSLPQDWEKQLLTSAHEIKKDYKEQSDLLKGGVGKKVTRDKLKNLSPNATVRYKGKLYKVKDIPAEEL